MEEYQVRKVNNLLKLDINRLVEESKEEGFRILERLVADYKDGTNTFKKSGECLLGVFNEKDTLIAIAGLNIDPFSNQREIGRLRRFYVSKDYRRKGIGSHLLKRIIIEAEIYFRILVLRTNTQQADQFYISHGFSKETTFLQSTHCLTLEEK